LPVSKPVPGSSCCKRHELRVSQMIAAFPVLSVCRI
jgi:hypothetical protein